jgi:Mce-associated membrane protein
VVTVLAALLVLVAAAGTYFGLRYRSASEALDNERALDAARTAALAAGAQYAVDLSSYDYQNLDKSFGAVIAHSTDAFAQQYRGSAADCAPRWSPRSRWRPARCSTRPSSRPIRPG